MDFYHIGAMKVFSQLGQLIEEDEHNQIKFSDLPSEVMEQIGSYLLEDKNKKISKKIIKKLYIEKKFKKNIYRISYIT